VLAEGNLLCSTLYHIIFILEEVGGYAQEDKNICGQLPLTVSLMCLVFSRRHGVGVYFPLGRRWLDLGGPPRHAAFTAPTGTVVYRALKRREWGKTPFSRTGLTSAVSFFLVLVLWLSVFISMRAFFTP